MRWTFALKFGMSFLGLSLCSYSGCKISSSVATSLHCNVVLPTPRLPVATHQGCTSVYPIVLRMFPPVSPPPFLGTSLAALSGVPVV